MTAESESFQPLTPEDVDDYRDPEVWVDCWDRADEIALRLIATIDQLRRERDAAREQRDHWKANHDDQVRIKRSISARYDRLVRVIHETIADQTTTVQATPSATDEARPRTGQDQGSAVLSEGYPPGSDCHCGRYQDENHREGCERR